MPGDAARLIEALARSGRTLAAAESFTGGHVLDALTDVPGASRVLVGGLVAYDDRVKTHELGVPQGILREHGAVSEDVALEMAHGARRLFGADYALATTGIAGPTGATPGKPVGLSYCAAVGPHYVATSRLVHDGSRAEVKAKTLHQVFAVLDEVLRREGTL